MVNFTQLIECHKPILMAIANITPDSFSDGGVLTSEQAIHNYLEECWQSGACMVDVGAESTKPNVAPIDSDTEIARLKIIHLPLKAPPLGCYFSLDTYKSKTAAFALENGFHIINDVTGLQHDPDMARIVADYGAGIILMHNQRMVKKSSGHIIQDVLDGFNRSLDIAHKHAIDHSKICLDIGIGFGLKPDENIILINNINRFTSFGFPIMVGASRKSFIEHFLGIADPKKRGIATLAAHHKAVINGASIIRVHDIAEHKQFFTMHNVFNVQ